MKSDICIWLVTTNHLEDTLWFREDLFRTSTFEEINDEQKKEVLRQLRYRFSSNVFQLARVVGLSYEAAARLMDSQ